MKVEWLPAEYMDEVVPPLRASADAWIVVLDDGAPCLAGEVDGGIAPRQLVDGEAVGFQTCTDYGEATLTIAEDGSYTIKPPMPPEAQQVMAFGDLESMSPTIDELVTFLKHDGQLEPGEVRLFYYTWADAPALRFDAASRKFVPAGSVQ